MVFLLQEKIFLTLGKFPFIIYDFIMHAICINCSDIPGSAMAKEVSIEFLHKNFGILCETNLQVTVNYYVSFSLLLQLQR